MSSQSNQLHSIRPYIQQRLTVTRTKDFLQLIQKRSKTIRINYDQTIVDDDHFKIARHMMNLKWLRYSHFNFLTPKHPTHAEINRLQQILLSLPHQEKLSLQIFGRKISCCVSEKSLGKVIQSLTKAKKMKELSFALATDKVHKETVICKLSENLRYLTHLQNLKFDLAQIHVLDRSFISLRQSLSRLHKLQKISFKVMGPASINEEKLETLLSYAPNIKSLKIFHLHFSSCDTITSQTINNLSLMLPKIPLLENLKLKFEGYFTINDSIYKKLLDQIASIYHLKVLGLSIPMCFGITEKSFENTLELLLRLPNLLKIDLNFAFLTMIEDRQAEKLADALLQKQNLRILKLNFALCLKLQDRGMQALAQTLSKLKNLKKIDINFDYGQSLINNDSVMIRNHLSIYTFIDLLSETKTLDNIILSFNNWRELDDFGLAKTGEAFIKLKNTKKLCLSFNFCYKITTESIQQFGDSVSQLNSLEDLTLSFRHCHGTINQKTNFIFKTSNPHCKVSLIY